MPREDVLEVLLVDDELATRELLEQFCRSRNMSVTTAHDGRAAITAIERAPSRFSVVLTDVHMPGADGFEVLKAARNGNRSCYVVMITGYASLDTALRAVREGAYDYLAKPFSLGQLDVMLARIKDRMALERELRDLRRRVHGSPAGAGAPPAPSTGLHLLAQHPAAQHTAVQHVPPPPSAPHRRPVAAPLLSSPLAGSVGAPAVAITSSPTQQRQNADVANRLGTIEERIARLEELLLAASVVSR